MIESLNIYLKGAGSAGYIQHSSATQLLNTS